MRIIGVIPQNSPNMITNGINTGNNHSIIAITGRSRFRAGTVVINTIKAMAIITVLCGHTMAATWISMP